MSRHLHHLPIPQQELDLRNKARLGAAAVLLAFMSALVVIAPDAGNPFIDGSHHASAPGDANAAD